MREGRKGGKEDECSQFERGMDAPPRPDEEVAQLVRLRSRERDARPAGVVDDMTCRPRHARGALHPPNSERL